MFLFSISSDGNDQFVMTRIFRKMRNLRMTYTLEKVEMIDSPADASKLSARLSSVYNDRSYIIINPRFSQVGRPTVKVEMRPRLFIDSGKYGGQVADILRKALVPVDSVQVHRGEEWKEYEGKGFGGDYMAPVNELSGFLHKIHSEGRLFFPDEFNMPGLREVMVSGQVPEKGTESAAYLAAAISVWFGEHKKQLKTHSAGGRVKI